ncbi:metallophosphoesterase family protein [Chloroflexota bacterium]
MRIGVLSDTHAGSFSELPDKILAALADADMIIHAGDFTSRNVLDGLKQMKEVRAVHGNMDSMELNQLLPETDSFSVGETGIKLAHGWGRPQGIDRRVYRQFGDADIIVYGHSHYPQNEMIDGILFFNPGPARDSFGIITIDDKHINGEIIRLRE